MRDILIWKNNRKKRLFSTEQKVFFHLNIFCLYFFSLVIQFVGLAYFFNERAIAHLKIVFFFAYLDHPKSNFVFTKKKYVF